MGRNSKNKNLSLLEMGNIQFYLNEGKSFAEIGRLLDRDRSTIRKEVEKYSAFVGIYRKCSNCTNKIECHVRFLCDVIYDRTRCSSCKYCNEAAKRCPHYETIIRCTLLEKNRNLCNGCELDSKCKNVKIKYNAELANKKHTIVQTVSRKDLKFDSFPNEFKDYISNRIKLGHSPEVILNTLNPKFEPFKFSVQSFYSYIDKGLLECKNIDLRNKVSRVRYGSNTFKRNNLQNHHLNGRSIENLDKRIIDTTPLGYFELDCVEGIKGGEVLFTIMIPCFSLMLAFKLHKQTSEEIKLILDYLEKTLDSYFYTLFTYGVPDNGSEFRNFISLENSIYSTDSIIEKRMSIFYTHPYSAFEKPHIENNHILLRWLIKKGYDITLLSSEDILNVINRLNNYPRKKLGFKTPIQVLENELGSDILFLLSLHHIPVDQLNMKNLFIF